MFENLPIQTSWYIENSNQKFAGMLCSEENDELVLKLNPVECEAPNLGFPIIGEAMNGMTISITDGYKQLEQSRAIDDGVAKWEQEWKCRQLFSGPSPVSEENPIVNQIVVPANHLTRWLVSAAFCPNSDSKSYFDCVAEFSTQTIYREGSVHIFTQSDYDSLVDNFKVETEYTSDLVFEFSDGISLDEGIEHWVKPTITLLKLLRIDTSDFVVSKIRLKESPSHWYHDWHRHTEQKVSAVREEYPLIPRFEFIKSISTEIFKKWYELPLHYRSLYFAFQDILEERGTVENRINLSAQLMEVVYSVDHENDFRLTEEEFSSQKEKLSKLLDEYTDEEDSKFRKWVKESVKMARRKSLHQKNFELLEKYKENIVDFDNIDWNKCFEKLAKARNAFSHGSIERDKIYNDIEKYHPLVCLGAGFYLISTLTKIGFESEEIKGFYSRPSTLAGNCTYEFKNLRYIFRK